MKSYTRKLQHGTLTVRCPEELKDQAQWLLDTICNRDNIGSGLKSGTRIQFGWTILSLYGTDRGLLVYEPNYDGNPPTETRPDVTTSLEVVAEQTRILREISVGGVPSMFADKIVVAKDILQEQDLYLQRSAERPGDSGWYIGPIDRSEVKEYEAIYVYQLLHRSGVTPGFSLAAWVPYRL